MKTRSLAEGLLEVLQFCERIVGDEAVEESRKLAKTGNLVAAAENLYGELSKANTPLPPAYWKTIAACVGKSLDELATSEPAQTDDNAER